MKNLIITSIVLTVTFFFSTQLTAQFATFQLPSYVSLNMNNIPQNLHCGKTWVENNATFQIIQTGNEVGCPGSCSAQSNGTSLWLAPSAVKVDISNVMLDAAVNKIYIHIKAYNGIGGTKAVLVGKNGQWVDLKMNTVRGRSETIILDNPNGIALSHVIISSCETEVLDMGIESENYVPQNEIEFPQQEVYQINPQGNFNQTVQFNGGF